MDFLKIENCTITYSHDTLAVDDVSLEVKEGEIISIVGESGSGKTTLIRAILGILPIEGRVSKGNIWFQGLDVTDLKESDLQSVRGKEIGMIFQNPGGTLDPIKRIGAQYVESIQAHNRKLSKKTCIEQAKEMLKIMQLTDVERVLKAYPCELSGGMKQRVGIAMAMTARPKLLLADEPTSALDVTIQAQVVNEIKELREKFKTTIILVTHNMGVASYLSDKIGVMKDGKLVEWGSRDEVIFHPKSEYTKILLEAVPKLEDI